MFTTPKQTGRASLFGRPPLNTSASGRRSLQPLQRATPGVANRSARAEQVLEETGQHVVKALNSPVPVQVQEALRGDSAGLSVKLHWSGWAWLVTGSRLLLWKFSAASQLSASCKQIALPSPPGLEGWSCDLVTVCPRTGSSDASLSVMAASPGGTLLHWPSALSERSAASEGAVDLGEGHCHALLHLEGSQECLLVSSLGALFLVSARQGGGVSARQWHVPRGVLSGFSHRMSSLFFGGGKEEEAQEARRVIMHRPDVAEDVVFLLSSRTVQKWRIIDSREQMVYEAPLQDMLKDAVIVEGWMSPGADGPLSASHLSIWVIDMQLCSGSVAVLFAVGLVSDSSAEYGIALVSSSSDMAPVAPEQLVQLRHKVAYKPGREDAITSSSLLGVASSPLLMIHSKNAVLLTDVTRQHSDVGIDVINFPEPNAIIGAGSHGGSCLFFTLNQGVVAIAQQFPGHAALHQSLTSFSRASASTSMVTTPTLQSAQRPPPAISSHHPLGPRAGEGGVAKAEGLKSAFMEYLNGNLSEAIAVCKHHFPPECFVSQLDTPCDVAVVMFSEMLLDDPPSNDPRWSGGGGKDPGTSTSSSVIIHYQLEDKLSAHCKYVSFLTDVGLLDKLTCVTVRGGPMLTRHLLCEHAEKIAATLSLVGQNSQVVDQAIKIALQQRSTAPRGAIPRPGLTHQDVFFTNVSVADDFFPALAVHQETTLPSMTLPNERVQLVVAVASIMEAALQEAVRHRLASGSQYQSCVAATQPDPEYLPWTASEGSRGMRRCLSQQIETTLDLGLKDARNSQEQQSLWQLMASLCDLLFAGYRDQTASLESNASLDGRLAEVNKKFEAERLHFITPFLECSQFPMAADLAEKYGDFQILVQLCEHLNSRDKLRAYMRRFADQGFADFLFKHYLDRGKLQQLLSYSDVFPSELGAFLCHHDNLSWIHSLATQSYTEASRTLSLLATRESAFVAKKKAGFVYGCVVHL